MDLDDRYCLFTSVISSLSYCIQNIKSMALSEFSIRGSSINCIFHLNRSEDGLTASELVELCQEDKSAVSRSLSELENRGFVKKETNGGRVYRVKYFLTENGKSAAARLLEVIHASVLAGGVDDENERQRLYRMLTDVLKGLETYIRNQTQLP